MGSNLTEGTKIYFSHFTLLEWNLKNCFVTKLNIKLLILSGIFLPAKMESFNLRYRFNPDPTIRSSVLSCLMSQLLPFMAFYGTNQTALQRYLALGTLRRATMWALHVVFQLNWQKYLCNGLPLQRWDFHVTKLLIYIGIIV